MSSEQEAITTSDEPTLTKAMNASTHEVAKWQKAIDEQLQALKERICGSLQRPQAKSVNALPLHILIDTNSNGDGSVDKFKALLVAGGSIQVYNQKYIEFKN